jgi:hypothetical protein
MPSRARSDRSCAPMFVTTPWTRSHGDGGGCGACCPDACAVDGACAAGSGDGSEGLGGGCQPAVFSAATSHAVRRGRGGGWPGGG